MTREEKCKLAIKRGYTYDPETGLIYNKLGIKVGHKEKNGYIRLAIRLKQKERISLFAHQFIWFLFYNECVKCLDHINGKRDDNRIINLRSVSYQQNHFNRTNVKGYRFIKKNNNWQARIGINKKEVHLGTFNTEEEARNAYLAAKEIYHKF